MDESPQMEQLIVAIRAACAAFSRGNIDAAVEPLELNGSNLPNSREVVRTRDARGPSNTFRNHVPPGPK
jgi:hypothetical protein